jgi:hypothetical protein
MTVRRVLRVLAAGTMWAAAYNLMWGLAWILFMRRAWTEAAAVAGQSMPWTPQFWWIWIPMTLPFGFAVGAYVLSRPSPRTIRRDAVAASLVVWVPGTIGMAFGAALTPGIIVIDSIVNLVAVFAASLLLAEGVTRLGSAGGDEDES